MAQNPAKRRCPSYDSMEGVSLGVGETNIELDVFSFKWTISNYSVLSDWNKIISPVFRGGVNNNHAWKLDLRPKMKFDEVEHLVLYLDLYDENGGDEGLEGTPVKAHFQLFILNADGQPELQAFPNKLCHTFTTGDNFWGGRTTITSAALVDPSLGLVANDTLRILCKIWVHGEIKEKVVAFQTRPSGLQTNQMEAERTLADFGKMFSESIATDITVSTENTAFKAHKAVLAARSPVFAVMFNVEMMEKETSTLEIPDFTDEEVKGMLEYVYTGKTNAMADNAEELLKMADKYDLEGLKESCEATIGENLSNDNVAGILVLAHTYNAPVLKARAISFINRNREELLKMQSFQDAVTSLSFAQTGVLAHLYLSTM